MRKTHRIFAALLLTMLPLQGALVAVTNFEVWQAGNIANGGCFAMGATGINYSLQATAQYSATDLVLVTPTTASSASHTFDADDIGNCLHITAGTNLTPGFYQIVSQTLGVATLDRAAGTMGATGGTYAVGGALALPSQATNTSPGNIICVKADNTYVLSAGQAVAINDQAIVQGYTTVCGDGGKATFQANATSITMFSLSSAGNGLGQQFRNFILDCDSQIGTAGLSSNNNGRLLWNVELRNCRQTSISLGVSNACWRCLVTGQVTGMSIYLAGGDTTMCQDCWVLDPLSGTASAFTFEAGGKCIRCVGVGHASATSIDVFNLGAGNTKIDSSTCYTSGRDCYRFTYVNINNGYGFITNSVAYNTTGYCFNVNDTSGLATRQTYQQVVAAYNAGGACTAGEYRVPISVEGAVSLSADPFTNAAANDFSPNSVAGGGEALKGAGYPGISPAGTGVQDIGALQSAGSTPPPQPPKNRIVPGIVN